MFELQRRPGARSDPTDPTPEPDPSALPQTRVLFSLGKLWRNLAVCTACTPGPAAQIRRRLAGRPQGSTTGTSGQCPGHGQCCQAYKPAAMLRTPQPGQLPNTPGPAAQTRQSPCRTPAGVNATGTSGQCPGHGQCCQACSHAPYPSAKPVAKHCSSIAIRSLLPKKPKLAQIQTQTGHRLAGCPQGSGPQWTV